MNYYDYIVHYGVPGMKKGKRRWTNQDGTLNEAGKRRYASGQVGDTGIKAVPETLFDGSKSTKNFFYVNQRGQIIGTGSSLYPMTDKMHAENVKSLVDRQKTKKYIMEQQKKIKSDITSKEVKANVDLSKEAVSDALRIGAAHTYIAKINKNKKKNKIRGKVLVDKLLSFIK